MNRPVVVRGFIDNNIMHMLNRMRILAANYLPEEARVLHQLRIDNHVDLSVHLTKLLYELLGGEVTQPKDPRFCKTRRQLTKKRGRPPRGVPRSQVVDAEPSDAP